jgi:hypothetical protein
MHVARPPDFEDDDEFSVTPAFDAAIRAEREKARLIDAKKTKAELEADAERARRGEERRRWEEEHKARWEDSNGGPFGIPYDIRRPRPAGEKAKRERAKVNGAQQHHAAFDRKMIGITGAALDAKIFPPLNWIVPGLLPEGFFVFAGRIKLGKSFLLMGVSSAVGMGGYALGSIECPQGDVLHLALEDNERRLKERQAMLLGDGMKPDLVEYNTTWPRLNNGGIEEIERWAESKSKPRLVVIDTIKMVRRPQLPNEGVYDYDYSSVEALRALANKHRLGIVGVHHLNKRIDGDDPFDLVSGSNGLSACADGTFILNRDGQGCTLYVRGRDVSEADRALTFANGHWTLLGDAEFVRRSEERANILDAIANIGGPASPEEIAGAIGQKSGNVRFLLHKMMKDGQVIRAKRGLYTAPPTPPPLTSLTN